MRVATHRTVVGSQVDAGTPVLDVSDARKVVHADVKLADQRLAARGTAVTITMPDGTVAHGKVTRVGTATERREGDGTAVVIPTTIGLTDPSSVRRFQRAAVTVRFAGARRRGVLSVPVDALVALNDTRFGVEVPAARGRTRRVPVRTGLFAGGRVAIAGRGIHAGLAVVVPSE